MRRRISPSIATVLAGALLTGCGWLSPEPPKPTVVFIVLDTVRSDHMSLCGYERPTTPTLDALVAAGGKINCDTWAPASWTMPSHASYFTGVTPEKHKAHSIVSGIKSWEGAQTRARKLVKGMPTLAEKMRDRGYQSLAVSANPVVSKKLGLMRGFEAYKVSPSWGRMFNDNFNPAVTKLIEDERDPTRPLFLFINIADGHQPWSPVPQGALGDAEAQPRLHYGKLDEEGPWRRFLAETMSPDEQTIFLSGVRDSYDYGVWRADKNVAALTENLTALGACENGCRFVLTSDHGEFMGEHGLLDHGNYLWEGMVRVPVMAWGWDAPDLDGVQSALSVHELVLDGALPETPHPAIAWSWPHARRCKLTNGTRFCDAFVGVREGTDKLLWQNGSVFGINLAADADELQQLPIAEDDPRYARMMAMGQISMDEASDDDIDPDVTEALRAAGYLE